MIARKAIVFVAIIGKLRNATAKTHGGHMTELASLDIKIDSRSVTPAKKSLDELTRSGERTESAMNELGSAAEKASGGMARAGRSAGASSGQIDRMGRSATDAAGGFGALGLAISTVGIVAAIAQYAKVADSVTTLNNQLKLATGSAQAASAAYAELYAIAQRSGVSFTELGGTFAAIARSGAQLGVSQQRLLTVTESISNAMAVGGGSAQGMQAALVQLGQGIASGTLRGEELNSVMEQTPRLAQAIADGLGVPIGKLREMGSTGQITAEALIGALESQAAVLKGEVASSQMTVAQSMTKLSNATTVAVGDFDKATGASRALVDAINSVTSAVDAAGSAFKNNETAINTTLGVMGGAAAAAGLASVAANIGKVRIAVAALGAVLAANPVTLALLGIGAAVGGFVAYNAAQEKTVDGIKRTIAALEEQSKAPHIYDRNPEGIKKWEAENGKRLEQVKKLRAEMALLTSAGDAESAAETARLASTKAAQAANNKLTDTYDRLTESLGGVRGKNAEYQQSLKDIQELREKGKITEAKANEWLTELAKKHGEAGKAAKKGAKEVDEFAQALNAVQDKQAGLSGDYDKKLAALYAGYQKGRIGATEYADAVGELIKQQPFYAAQLKAQAEAEKAIAEARDKARKLADQDIDVAMKSADQVAAHVQRLREENDLIGLTNEARAQALILREQQTIADQEIALIMQQNAGADEVKLQQLEREINLRKQLVGQMQIGAEKTEAAERTKKAADEAKNAAKAAADEFDRAAQQIEQSLTDALMNGGKSGAEYLEGLFRTLVLRPVVSAIISPIAAGVQSLVSGVMGGGGGAGGVGSMLGSAASSLGTSALFGGTSLSALGSAFGEGFMATLSGSTIGGGGAAGTGMAGTLGAAAPYALAAGAVLAAVGAFRTTKTVGGGLTGTLGEGDIKGYDLRRKSGYLFGGPDYSTRDAGVSAQSDTIQKSYLQMRTASVGMADALGLGSDAIKNFTTRLGTDLIHPDTGGIGLKLDGLNEQQVQEKVAQAMGAANDQIAAEILGVKTTTVTSVTKLVTEAVGPLDEWGKSTETVTREVTESFETVGVSARKDLLPWMQRIVDQGGPTAETLQKLYAYSDELLKMGGTSKDELIKIYTEGFMSGDVAGAGQAVADTLVASIEQTMIGSAASQIFDIANRGIITPIIDAMLNGQTLSQALSDGAIEATITKIKAQATALATVMNDPRIKELMDGLRSSLGGALGSGSTAGVTPPRYQQQPTAAADSMTKAAEEAEKAAEEARKKWQDITDTLLSDRESLLIEKLRAQGREADAVAMEFEIATRGMDEYQIGLVRQNQQTRQQIDLLNKTNAQRDEYAGLEVELLRAQGREAEAVAAQRRIDVRGMSDTEIELYDLNEARRGEISLLGKISEQVSQYAAMEVELLRAQGREAEALALQRQIETKGMSAAEVELYDLSAARRAEIDSMNRLGGMRAEAENLNVQLLRAQGREAEALALQRQIETKGMSDAEIQLYDLNEARKKEIDGIAKNKEALTTLWQSAGSVADRFLSGDSLKAFKYNDIARQINAVVPLGVTGAVLQGLGVSDIQKAVAEFVGSNAPSLAAKNQILNLGAALIDMSRAATEATAATKKEAALKALANQAKTLAADKEAAEKRVTELQLTFAATDAAMDAVSRAADAQRKIINDQLAAAQKAEASLKSIFDLLTDAVREMRGEVKATADMQYAEARRIIDVARLTGVLPDQERLGFAVTAARKGVADSLYGSRFERDRASILLANDLDSLQKMADGQLSTAEQSVVLLEDQLKAIDDQIKIAQDAVDTLRSVDKTTKPLPEAIDLLQTKIAAEKQAREQIEGLKLSIAANEAALILAQTQIDAINNVNTSVSSVESAINGLGANLWGAMSVVTAQQPQVYQPAAASSGSRPAQQTPPPPAPADSAGAILEVRPDLIAEAKLILTTQGPQALYDAVKNSGFTIAEANTVLGLPQGTLEAEADKMGLPRFASGGRYSGGLALVGERGPELINFDSSGYVANAQNTRAMVQGGGSETEIQSLKAELAEIKSVLVKIASSARLSASILDDVTQSGTAFRTITA